MKLLKIRHLFGVKHTCHIVSYVWQAKGNHMTTASARGYRKKAVRCMPQDPQASRSISIAQMWCVNLAGKLCEAVAMPSCHCVIPRCTNGVSSTTVKFPNDHLRALCKSSKQVISKLLGCNCWLDLSPRQSFLCFPSILPVSSSLPFCSFPDFW